MRRKIILGQMIDYLRRQNGLSMEELGNDLGKNKSTISRWINGTRFPKIEEAEEVANYFNVPFEVLVFGGNDIKNDITIIYNKLNDNRKATVYSFAENQLFEQNKESEIEEIPTVYVFSRLSAGTGIIDLDPDDVEKMEYDGYVPKHDLAFQVSGNSMTPLFEDGELVFVEKTEEIRSGQVIAVQINEEAYIKKAYIEENQLRLVSLNTEYDDIYANSNDDIRIVGRVIL